jgi:Protein of unknown function (DUF3300)
VLPGERARITTTSTDASIIHVRQLKSTQVTLRPLCLIQSPIPLTAGGDHTRELCSSERACSVPSGDVRGMGLAAFESMNMNTLRSWRNLLPAIAFLIGQRDVFALTTFARMAAAQAPSQSSSSQETTPIPPGQLDALVAPIALYPDDLLAQTLAASTYPLELVQLQQWLARNSELKDKALADAVAKQPWDPSVQAMAALPEVVKRLADDIQWTTDLGNAFLAQQSGVMDAVQRMRRKAEDKGNLTSTQQQVVETRIVEEKQVIVIEQASPQVVYVPSYDPVAVYGPLLYPYPPIYYPPVGAYAVGRAISFGAGVAMGAFWGGGGWGWNAGWGHNDININRNNTFVRNANVSGVRGGSVSNTWQHNAAHRGGAPYRDQATANRFGGTARGDSLANRQSQARQQIGRQGGQVGTSGNRPGGGAGIGNRPGGGAGIGDRPGGGAGIGNRPGGGAGIGDRPGGGAGIGNRPGGGAGIGDRPGGGAGIGNRPGGGAGIGDRPGGGAGVGNRPGGGGGISNRPSGGDRVGHHDLSRGGNPGAFGGGGSRGFDGAGARASHSRGSSSFGSRGGGSRGGGGRSGGGRGGGGRGGGGRR